MRLCATFFAFAALASLAAAPAPAGAKLRVVFTTSEGAFTLELDPAAAPATGAPGPICKRSASPSRGMASALAVKSLTTSRRSSANRWRSAAMENDQG